MRKIAAENIRIPFGSFELIIFRNQLVNYFQVRRALVSPPNNDRWMKRFMIKLCEEISCLIYKKKNHSPYFLNNRDDIILKTYFDSFMLLIVKYERFWYSRSSRKFELHRERLCHSEYKWSHLIVNNNLGI